MTRTRPRPRRGHVAARGRAEPPAALLGGGGADELRATPAGETVAALRRNAEDVYARVVAPLLHARHVHEHFVAERARVGAADSADEARARVPHALALVLSRAHGDGERCEIVPLVDLLSGAPDGHPAVNVELFAGTWPFSPERRTGGTSTGAARAAAAALRPTRDVAAGGGKRRLVRAASRPASSCVSGARRSPPARRVARGGARERGGASAARRRAPPRSARPRAAEAPWRNPHDAVALRLCPALFPADDDALRWQALRAFGYDEPGREGPPRHGVPRLSAADRPRTRAAAASAAALGALRRLHMLLACEVRPARQRRAPPPLQGHGRAARARRRAPALVAAQPRPRSRPRRPRATSRSCATRPALAPAARAAALVRVAHRESSCSGTTSSRASTGARAPRKCHDADPRARSRRPACPMCGRTVGLLRCGRCGAWATARPRTRRAGLDRRHKAGAARAGRPP